MKKPPGLRTFLLLLTILCVSIGASQQKKKMNVAVFDFEARGGLSKEDANVLTDVFQGQIVQTGEFVVVDRARIKTILEELGFQQSEACSNVQCQVEVGKILKVERMFVGNVGKVGSIWSINIQLVDIATAQILMIKTKQHSGSLEELATTVIPDIAAEMASGLTGKKITAKVETSGGTSWLWYVGGVVLVGGGAAAAVLLKGGAGTSTGGSTTTALPTSPKFPGQ